jgi:hypothetical protein
MAIGQAGKGWNWRVGIPVNGFFGVSGSLYWVIVPPLPGYRYKRHWPAVLWLGLLPRTGAGFGEDWTCERSS